MTPYEQPSKHLRLTRNSWPAAWRAFFDQPSIRGWFVLSLALSTATYAGGPDLEPSEADIQAAARLARTYRQADGIPRALRALGRNQDELQHDVAFTVLVERAAEAMPQLLDAIAAGDRPDTAERDEVWRCSQNAPRVALAAVCSGRDDSDVYKVDRRPESRVEKSRAAAQQGLLRYLQKPGPRQKHALHVLVLAAPKPSRDRMTGCDTYFDLVRQATPALVAFLSKKEEVTAALMVLSSGGGERSLAGPAIRPFLADKQTLPWAAMALARMDEDMSSSVARLVDLLTEPEIEAPLEALQAIGPRARAALPHLVALSKRIDATCARPVPAPRFVEALMAITRQTDDSAVAVQALAPLLRCSSYITSVAEPLANLGPGGRKALLAYVGGDEHTIQNRLDVAHVLQKGNGPIDSDIRKLIELMHAKRGRHDVPPSQVQMPMPKWDPIPRASEELTYCRSEASLPPAGVAAISDEQAHTFSECLESHLCGPSEEVFRRTLTRCCTHVFGSQQPAFCRP